MNFQIFCGKFSFQDILAGDTSVEHVDAMSTFA